MSRRILPDHGSNFDECLAQLGTTVAVVPLFHRGAFRWPYFSSEYARQVGTSGAGIPPGVPGCARTEPSSVAKQKFLTPVLSKLSGAELPTNCVLMAEAPEENPAAKNL